MLFELRDLSTYFLDRWPYHWFCLAVTYFMIIRTQHKDRKEQTSDLPWFITVPVGFHMNLDSKSLGLWWFLGCCYEPYQPPAFLFRPCGARETSSRASSSRRKSLRKIRTTWRPSQPPGGNPFSLFNTPQKPWFSGRFPLIWDHLGSVFGGWD